MARLTRKEHIDAAECAVDVGNPRRANYHFQCAGYGHEDIATFYGEDTWAFLRGLDTGEIDIYHGCVWHTHKYRPLHPWTGAISGKPKRKPLTEFQIIELNKDAERIRQNIEARLAREKVA